MTYCLATLLDDGLVFLSDSRTNAGIDQLGVYSKMHVFDAFDDRFFALLSAGNLATTQAVVARIRRDLRENAATSLAAAVRMRDAADYIGELSRDVQERYAGEGKEGFSAEANFIFGGRIGDAPQALFHVYPQGNFVEPTAHAPFLQIGEQKYGKPILDRIIRKETDLHTAARCGLVSMDSTMRSNAGVGPPIELLMCPADRKAVTHVAFEENDPYLKTIRESWERNVRQAFELLPPLDIGEAGSPLSVVNTPRNG